MSLYWGAALLHCPLQNHHAVEGTEAASSTDEVLDELLIRQGLFSNQSSFMTSADTGRC